MQTMEEIKTLVFRESRLRSLVKSLTYRLLSLAGTFILCWVITGNIKETVSITVAVQIFLVILYYVYERIWDKVSWGRKIEPT
jgi:uncharacterized membrane protein